MKDTGVALPMWVTIRKLFNIPVGIKGYYNDIFAPGWTVASLWELFTPGRAEIFMER